MPRRVWFLFLATIETTKKTPDQTITENSFVLVVSEAADQASACGPREASAEGGGAGTTGW